MKRLLLVALLVLAFAAPAWAGIDEGWADAQHNISRVYDNGRGVPQDYAESVKWYRISRVYDNGRGVPQDYAESVKWYRIGLVYDNGRGVSQDYAEAVKWYRKSAEQGYADAQNNLGFMYGSGRGVRQDYAEALKWYRLAAEQGFALAQNNLGTMYGQGQGVPQDYVQAHMWFNLAAAASGNEKAVKNRDIAAKKMTAADVSKAQRLAREWLEEHQADAWTWQPWTY
jgi:TPR repeat protein